MISVVVCSHEDARFEACERQFAKGFGDVPYELIRIADAKGLAEGYNRGLDLTNGEIVVFSHDDIEFLLPDVGRLLARHMETYDCVGVAGTDVLAGPLWNASGPPHLFGQVAHKIDGGYSVCMYGAHRSIVGGMQALDGLFLSFRRRVIEAVRWDEAHFPGFHLYDIDCTYRAYRLGFELAVACDLPLCHLSGGKYDERWKEAAQEFMRMYGGELTPRRNPQWQFATRVVATRMEALQLMTPHYLRAAE